MHEVGIEKTKAPTLAGDEAFKGSELGGTLSDNNSIVSELENACNDITGYREQSHDTDDSRAIVSDDEWNAEPASISAQIAQQSTDEWLDGYDAQEKAEEVQKARLARRAEQARTRYQAKNAGHQAPKFNVRESGGFHEEVFGLGDEAFFIRCVDSKHPDALRIAGEGLDKWHGVFKRVFQALKHGGGEMKEVQVSGVPLYVSRIVKEEGKTAVELKFLPAGSDEWISGIWWLDELLSTDIKGEVWSELARKGLVINRLHLVKEMIKKAVIDGQMTHAVEVVNGTTRTGWHDNEFVAAGFHTEHAPEFIGAQTNSLGTWQCAGDREAYMGYMRELLAHNPNVALIAGYFVAGSIISRVSAENFLLGLVGESSEGKTLAVRTALSMRGQQAEFATFDSTANALKTLLNTSNDQCLVIDEVGQSNARPEDQVRFVYDVSQGKMRARMTRDAGGFAVKADLKKASYSVIFTGELSILAGVKNAPTGTQVRTTELHFDRKAGRPLWHTITTHDEAKAHERFITENHGWIMPLVIERIRELDDNGLRVLFDSYSQMLTAQSALPITEATTRRKLQIFAAALTGADLLADVLGFKVDLAIARALELGDLTAKAAAETGSENDHYDAVLRNTLLDTKWFIQPLESDNDRAPERPMGEVVKKGEDVFVRIIADKMDDFCRYQNIDRGRFINWARDNAILTQHGNGKDRKGNPRFTDQVKCKVGGKATMLCFVFEMSKLDEMEAKAAAEEAIKEAQANMSDYDDTMPADAENADYGQGDESIPF